MPLITQGKTNWKFLLVVIILFVFVCLGVLYLYPKFSIINPPPIQPPKTEGEFLYVLTQNWGTLATEPTDKFEWPYFEILKIDPKSSEIVKRTKGDGLGIKIKEGGNIYLLAYRFPQKIRELKKLEEIVRAIQEIKSSEELEKFIAVYDKDLNQLASQPSKIFDFEVNENYLYGLREKVLEITDFKNPSSPIRVSSLDFEKTSQDIIFQDDKLYLLDDVMMPLYLHLVDVKNPKEPKLSSYQTQEINAHLDTQDVTDKWFAIESYVHMGGGGKNLLVFNTNPPIEELASVTLNEYSRLDTTGKVVTIRGIKIIDNYLYALNLADSNTIELLVYDLKDFKKAEIISTLTLEENKNLSPLENLGITPILIRKGNLLYYSGYEGVYTIDITNPSKPSKKDVIKTDFQVTSLESRRNEVQSYIACGCGCCGGEEPAVKCLYYSKGDDIKKIIEEDKKAAQDPICPTVGCSKGIKYIYCD